MLQQLELPLDATGYGEFELQAAGLYGDSLMLGYSTTGQLTGSVRQGVMTFDDKLSETSTDNVFEIPELNANFDRGRFTLEPMHIIGASSAEQGTQRVQTLNGEVSGELDLLKILANTLYPFRYRTNAIKSQESSPKLSIPRLTTANKKAPLHRSSALYL